MATRYRDYKAEYQRRAEKKFAKEAVMKAIIEKPVEVPELIRVWGEQGIHKTIAFIHGNIMDLMPAHNSRDVPAVRKAYKEFGELWGKALKADSPSILLGRRFEYVDYSRIFKEFENTFKCAHCAAIATTDAEHGESETEDTICNLCLPFFVHSTEQGCLVLREGARQVVVDGVSGALSWVSEEYLHNCVNHPRGSEHWYTQDAWTDVQERDRGKAKTYAANKNPFAPAYGGISNYHSSKSYVERLPSPMYDSARPPLLVGIELELELVTHDGGIQREQAAQKIRGLFNGPKGEEHYCLTENDGSLTHGFEIVTGWTGLDTHERILSKLRSPEFEQIKKDFSLASHDTKTCGLHVTLDRAGMSDLHRGKFVLFLNHPDNAKFIEEICRRNSSYGKKNFSKYKSVASSTEKSKAAYRKATGHGEDRYEIANFSGNRHAVEFRGPRGTLRFESIMATMEFIRLVWMFTKHESMQELTVARFIDFVWQREHAHESRYLRQYMVDRKLCVDAVEVPAKPTRRFTVQESLVDAVAMGFIVDSPDA